MALYFVIHALDGYTVDTVSCHESLVYYADNNSGGRGGLLNAPSGSKNSC